MSQARPYAESLCAAQPKAKGNLAATLSLDLPLDVSISTYRSNWLFRQLREAGGWRERTNHISLHPTSDFLALGAKAASSKRTMLVLCHPGIPLLQGGTLSQPGEVEGRARSSCQNSKIGNKWTGRQKILPHTHLVVQRFILSYIGLGLIFSTVSRCG